MFDEIFSNDVFLEGIRNGNRQAPARRGELRDANFCRFHNAIGQRCPEIIVPCKKGDGCVLFGPNGESVPRERVMLVDGIMVEDLVKRMGSTVWEEQKHNEKIVRHAIAMIKKDRNRNDQVYRESGKDYLINCAPHSRLPTAPSECLATGCDTVDSAFALLQPLMRGAWAHRDGEGANWDQGLSEILEKLGPQDPIEGMLACLMIRLYLQAVDIEQIKDVPADKRAQVAMQSAREFMNVVKLWKSYRGEAF